MLVAFPCDGTSAGKTIILILDLEYLPLSLFPE
jgi:hypothetical protein